MTDILFPKQDILDHVLVALRRIVRAIDIHSKKLGQSHHLTIPQVVLLREIYRNKRLSLSDLAKLASLSNATVTGIVDRLESRKLVRRVRSETDRRQVFVEITSTGIEAAKSMPPLLQESFIRQLRALPKWEQAQILSSLQRVAAIMNAEGIDAAPILAPHILTESGYNLSGDTKAASGPGKEDLKKSSLLKEQFLETSGIQSVHLREVHSLEELPPEIGIAELSEYLHETLKPYEDTLEDVEGGIRDALAARGREGGFILIAESDGRILGALVMQKTGMKGYVPENILLFVAVSPEMRGKGLGRLLVERALELADGNVKLHVEYDNPARKLYERIGFTNKYAEMRYLK